MRYRLYLAALALLALCAAAPAPPAVTPAAISAHIKHVFVLFQENHSFDNLFGTYPGAENLTTALARSHGFRQRDPLGKTWIVPFRLDDPDIESPSQARKVLFEKMNGGAMDQFVAAQENTSLKRFSGNEKSARSVGLETMGHYDCDTLPFLWKYAHSFALFDRVFAAMTGPSTPNNVSVIAAQAGQTQWARHPAEVTAGKTNGLGVPIYNDVDPGFGPYFELYKPVQIPQAYATLMLLLGGTDDARATNEIAGVADDLQAAVRSRRAPIPWGWYQEGYISPTAAGPGYSPHHNAPQYFGYLHQNDVFWKNVHSPDALLDALQNSTLPDRGVFYVKGGSQNPYGWKPANRDPYVQAHYLGDDDHPGPDDSDHQLAESFVAKFVNAIARSPYWKDSAIVISWDDPGGFYDHVPAPKYETCPDGNPCGDGPRVPLIVISPYAKSGAIVSDTGDTASIVKFAETVFGLPAMSSLPDEKPYMPEGPRDGNAAITDLLGAFDPARLAGTAPPIPAGDAEIPDDVVGAFPPNMNCASLGITPAVPSGASQAPPDGFHPRVQRR